MKKIILLTIMLLMYTSTVSVAAIIDEDMKIAVMDFGTHKGTSEPDFNLMNAETASSEYIIQRLIDKYKINIIDKEMVSGKLQAENLNTTGLIDPDTAKRIGEILNVDYLIYGNVTDVSLAENPAAMVRVRTVKAHIVARIMEVKTGKIIMAAKGVGKSTSSSLTENTKIIMLGSVKVSQTSVHNALQKAAFQAADILIERLYATKK